jgi:hypothetical protein
MPAQEFSDVLAQKYGNGKAENVPQDAIGDEMKANPPQNLPNVVGGWLEFNDAVNLEGVNPPLGKKDQYMIFAFIGDWKNGAKPQPDQNGMIPKDSIVYKNGQGQIAPWDFAVYQPTTKLWINVNHAVMPNKPQEFYVKDKVDAFIDPDKKEHNAIAYYAAVLRAKAN